MGGQEAASNEHVDALVTAVELTLDIASQPAYRALAGRQIAPAKRLSRDQTVAFVRRACFTFHHPVGTCAMGTGPEAVVDAELRLHGIQGLRIADASVMPTIPSGPTNAASVMIGEFASQLLVAGDATVLSGRDARVSVAAPLEGEAFNV